MNAYSSEVITHECTCLQPITQMVQDQSISAGIRVQELDKSRGDGAAVLSYVCLGKITS